MDGNIEKQQLYQYLCQFITPERKALIEKNATLRTRYITIALENIYQPHNASAVLRTADALGIQDIHIIENRNKYSPNPDVSIGAEKWLTLKKYKNTQNKSATFECISQLKENGYKIIATTPHTQDISLTDLSVTQKTAFLFGTEKEGLTEEAITLADGFVKIPMYGFSESYNISVAAAIVLFTVIEQLRRKSAEVWKLSDAEILDLQLEWVKKTVKKPELLIQEYLQNNSNN